MKKYAGIGMIMAGALCVWGVLYPELYLHPDIIRVVCDAGDATALWGPESYVKFLDAEADDVTVKCKLAEYLKPFLKAE